MRQLPTIYSASAGSGKTYTIAEHIYDQIVNGSVSPDKIIATTFTKKAARELRERIRTKLISEGKTKEANLMNQALIGTINSVCLQLLQRYAFESGLSPDIETIDENDQKILLTELLGEIVDNDFLELAYKLFQSDNDSFSTIIPYQQHISKIISELKANDLHVDQLKKCGEESINAYLGLDQNTELVLHATRKEEVLSYLKTGIEAVDKASLSKSAKVQFNELQNTYRNIKNDSFTWHEWISLSKVKLANSYLPKDWKNEIAPLVIDLLSYDSFRIDYSKYIKKCFTYAKEIVERYDSYKLKRGLMDFMDQESKLYTLIQDPKISGDIGASYDLLVVDEFQDVSPLQLAIFLRFSDIVNESVWVGDPKQSIYGFRGSDPVLMKAVLDYIPDEKTKTLDHSYRSREPLVHYTNTIFTEAFKSSLGQEAIVLSPAPFKDTKRAEHEEDLMSTAVHYWEFESNGTIKKTDSYACLSNQIKQLLDQAPKVFDKSTASYRPATYKDIAILCRTNRNAQALGQILSDAGMLTAVSGDGLIHEPEVVVVMALLKLLIFPTDALAKAELLLHTTYDGDQATMIEKRLDYENNKDWGADHPLITGLEKIREQGFDFAPSTMIEVLVSELQLYELFASWGQMTRRPANIDALLEHTIAYQEMCNRLDMASSIGGLLSHLKQLNETNEDLKGERSGNAIQVTTYHKSKGLEWPIVVVWDLDIKLRERYYGVRTISHQALNIDDPLANRTIRLTIKPFNRVSKIEGYDKVIDADPEKKKAYTETIEEEKRLAYVAITRARDYLYLCVPTKKDKPDKTEKKKKKKTFERPDLINPKMNQWNLDDGVYETIFTWDNKQIPMVKRTFAFDNEIELNKDHKQSLTNYFTSKSGIIDFPSQRINPSATEPLTVLPKLDISRIHDRHYIDKSNINDAQFGDVIHALICAYNPDIQNYKRVIADLLSQYGYEQFIDASWLKGAIASLYDHISTTYPDGIIHKELPIQSVDANGHLINGYIDLLVELPDGLVIVDHKTFVIKDYHEGAYIKKAQGFTGQLDLYGELLEKGFGKGVLGRVVYFVLEGVLVRW